MSRVIIFHGTDCKPEDFWYEWLKHHLEAKGHTVELPHYPEMNREPIDTFVQKVTQNHQIDQQTVLIGHSAGVPLILSILERISLPVTRALLVAGFIEELPGGGVEPILQTGYDWEVIRRNAKDFVTLNSVNDPWGCNEQQGKKIFEGVGGTFVIRNDGHFGSSKDPGYKEFPLLLNMVEAEL
jgi:predicted alpha/beta hydrolase family esterase